MICLYCKQGDHHLCVIVIHSLMESVSSKCTCDHTPKDLVESNLAHHNTAKMLNNLRMDDSNVVPLPSSWHRFNI